MTRSSQVDPHASRSQPRCVTEPQMGGFMTDNFRQVHRPGHCLKGKRLPICELAVEVQR